MIFNTPFKHELVSAYITEKQAMLYRVMVIVHGQQIFHVRINHTHLYNGCYQTRKYRSIFTAYDIDAIDNKQAGRLIQFLFSVNTMYMMNTEMLESDFLSPTITQIQYRRST